jgi:hypothetical protein
VVSVNFKVLRMMAGMALSLDLERDPRTETVRSQGAGESGPFVIARAPLSCKHEQRIDISSRFQSAPVLVGSL